MSSAMMVERTGTQMPSFSYPPPSSTTPGVGTFTTPPTVGNWFMVPRCTFKFEKIANGYKMWCYCEDKVACSMVQNLCTMLAGGACSFGCTFNGATVCYYNFTFCYCKCEPFDAGVCFTFQTGDTQCCKMLQSCCENAFTCYETGCTCCFYMNGTPICCGFFGEGAPKTGKGK